MTVKKFLILSLSIVSVGCVNNQKAQQDILRLEGSLNDLRSFQAEQTTKITALESELRTLSGRFDELEYSQNQRVGSALNDLNKDVSTLKRRVPPPPIVPADALDQDEARVSSLPPEIGTPFGIGLQRIREGEFQQALAPLDEAITQASSSEWVPYVIFWTAVAYDGLNDHRKALENYHELVTRFRKHQRVPLTLLRQASVFARIGDSKTAKLTLNKLIAEYPKTTEAQRAKERLKDF